MLRATHLMSDVLCYVPSYALRQVTKSGQPVKDTKIVCPPRHTTAGPHVRVLDVESSKFSAPIRQRLNAWTCLAQPSESYAT